MQVAGQLPPDDEFARQVLTAATKMCKTLKELSAPFLPIILPRLLASITRTIDVRTCSHQFCRSLSCSLFWQHYWALMI